MWGLLEKSDKQQLVYQRGVGTDNDWGDNIDGWFGLQVDGKVDEAFSAIHENAKSGDRIFVFGFSRGALQQLGWSRRSLNRIRLFGKIV